MIEWGSPPDREDCRDAGVIDVIRRVAKEDSPLDGSPYPVVALIREARHQVRNKPKPLRVMIRGVGELLIGEDGWSFSD